MVYSNLTSPTSPVKDHLATMKGLLLSCKLVYKELRREILQNTNKYLSALKTEWDLAVPNYELLTCTPTTLAEVRTGIEIRIPNSFFRDRCSGPPLRATARQFAMISIPRALVRILPLHVTHISVLTYEDKTGPEAILVLNSSLPLLGFFRGSRKLMGENKNPILLDDGTTFTTTDNPFCADGLTFTSVLQYSGSHYQLTHNTVTPHHHVSGPIVEHYALHPFGGRSSPNVSGRTIGDWSDEICGKWQILYNIIDFNGIRILTGKTFHKLVEVPDPQGSVEYVKDLKERH